MPSKSMSPMHMQPKIGDASLKFGPDWLRALSSDTGNNAGGGDGGGRGSIPPGAGWGGGMGHHMNSSIQRDYSATVSIHHHASLQQQAQNSQNKDGKDFQQLSSSNSVNRFKPSEFRYSREEMLSLYDKNLEAPTYLQAFGTLLIEKMQPPLAFSQPSEEEIRIWHTPQPESSRQGGVGAAPMGRGSYSVRGRGVGIERGRGRGRGGYYVRPHDDEERSFSRPRTFERSQVQSAHERVWAERNGNVGGPPPGEEGGSRGGSWRTREPYSGGRRHDDDDGWRKPRWRREEEDDSPRTNSGRRLHKSWSEDDAHDNLPEWARDNPCEESGTFDASGAFHGDDRSRKDSESARDVDGNSRSNAESESHGSQIDRVQKRTPDRNETSKSVIPPVLEEEGEFQSEKERYMTSSMNNLEGLEKISSNSSDSMSANQLNERNMKLGPNRSAELLKSHLANQNHLQQVLDEVRGEDIMSASKMVSAVRDDVNRSRTTSLSKNSEDDPYRSMTEEAMNLVSKLIEEDMSGSRGPSTSVRSSKASTSSSSQGLVGSVSGSGAVNSNVALGLDELTGNPAHLKNTPVSGVGGVHGVVNHTASMDVWLYRDPQGSVQGPFPTHEMALWYSQGYFSANLLLRRECDKVFVTLLEMGRLYGRNPFAIHHDSPPPPPILEPLGSALDLHRNDGNGQPHFQRHQQMLHQNILREQQHQQFVMSSMAPGATRKDEAWQGSRVQNTQQIGRNAGNTVPLSPDPVQAQMLMNLAKNQNLNLDSNSSNPIDHLQALFQRQNQMKNIGGDVPVSVSQQQQQQASTNDVFNPHMHSQINPQVEVRKSPVNASDPIQSLFQQLTNMTNTQQQQPSHHPQHKLLPGSTSDMINHWGGSHSTVGVQQQGIQGQWMSQPWELEQQLRKQQKLHEEEMHRRQKEEEEKERKRQADEQQRKLLEEQKREVEERERKLREEEALKQQEVERARQKEIARQKELLIQQQREQQQRLIDQQRLEQQRRIELEMEQQRQLEQQRQMEQQRQIEQQRQMEQQRQLEQQRREQQQLLEKQRIEEQRRQEQQQRELQEQHQREREQKLRLEEQQQRERLEQQAKLQQQQEQQRFSWNANSSQNSANVKARTLLEIQQEEALKQEQEEIMRQQLLKKQMQQQEQIRQQQQSQAKGGINLKWAQGAAPQAKVAIKSLTEIQAEEQAKLAKQKEKEREQRAIIQHHHQQQQAWSANLTWANRASLNAPTSNKTNGGVWDEPMVGVSGKHGFQNTASGSKMNQSMQHHLSNNQGHQQVHGGKRTKETDESFMKLFHVSEQSGKQSVAHDDFTKWCFESLQAMGGNIDIPTFVGFLKEVESPYEVSDYVRSYLGDGREAREFSREFLERRSRWKNARKGGDDGEASEDNLCRPASAVNPNQNDFQEVKGKGKKGKKGKMQKVDARNLGFNVNAPTRLNAGKRDYDEGTD